MRAFVLALSLLVSHAAKAQDVQNGQAFGDWAVNCSAVAVGQTACVLQQQILRSEDRAFVAQLLAFRTPDHSKTFLSARVPVGVYFPAGFAIRPENSDEILRFVWQSCGRDLCEAAVEIDAETLAKLTAEGTTILGAYRPNIQAENFVFSFSMTGAAQGLDALKRAQE